MRRHRGNYCAPVFGKGTLGNTKRVTTGNCAHGEQHVRWLRADFGGGLFDWRPMTGNSLGRFVLHGNPICNNSPCAAATDCRDESRSLRNTSTQVSGEEDWIPRYNVAPTQPVPVIRQNPKEPVRELSLMRWGLIPSWAKDPSVAASMINARAETAAMKPAFRDAMKSRRCLIPADGFCEWMRTGKTKQPYCFEVNEGDLFAFAGLWEGWKDPSRQWVKSCSIFTTTPNR